MTWELGPNLTIRDRLDRENAAYFAYLSRNPYVQSWEADRQLVHAMTIATLETDLFWKLGERWQASHPLAVKLFEFSLHADRIWERETVPYSGRSAKNPMCFLAGMGATLTNDGWGQVLFRNPFTWPANQEQLAYKIWQAEQSPNGKDRYHWHLAGWLLKILDEAREMSSHPSEHHFLRALGNMILRKPWETLRIFEQAC